MAKQAPITATCTCQHAAMWHKPDCRIAGCDCQEFERSVIRRAPDGSWMQVGQPSRARRPSRGQGPNE